MKKIKFLAVALAALTMLSCSKETDQMNEVPSGVKANVTISLQGSETRATGSPGSHENDDDIKNYIVFFFNADGALVSSHDVSNPAAPDANKLETTTAAKRVYVVANVGPRANRFPGITSETELKEVKGSLAKERTPDGGGDPIQESTQTGTNVWSAGGGDVSFIGDVGTATVSMSFPASKIIVVVDDQRTGNDGADGGVQITNTHIVLLNAGGECHFFGPDWGAQTQWFTGDDSYLDAPDASKTEVPFLSERYAANGVYFYAFGNNSATNPTILAIKANRVENGTTTVVYYPIAFSSADAGATDSELAQFEPGHAYTVTLTLKGNVGEGGGGGTVDPEEPLLSADVTVTITPATWIPKVVNKEFN